MTWYAADLTFRGGVSADAEDEPLYETSIRLIQADNEDDAMTKAERIGKDNEHEYLNDAKEKVAWTFVKVCDLQEIEDQTLGHGTELFSRMSRSI